MTLEGPSSAPALVVLAHGAGAGMTSEFMERIGAGIAAHGMQVCRFNFLYMERGRKAPDKQAVLEQTWTEVVDALRRRSQSPRLLFLGGKSLGGRIASNVVAAGVPAAGLVFLGYPLHPPGRPDRVRETHLLELTVPMLFVEGTRDPFCPLPALQGLRARLRAESSLVVIDDGDHSLKVRRTSGRTTADAWDEAAEAASSWVQARIP